MYSIIKEYLKILMHIYSNVDLHFLSVSATSLEYLAKTNSKFIHSQNEIISDF